MIFKKTSNFLTLIISGHDKQKIKRAKEAHIWKFSHKIYSDNHNLLVMFSPQGFIFKLQKIKGLKKYIIKLKYQVILLCKTL